jgi:hypothetical protein
VDRTLGNGLGRLVAQGGGAGANRRRAVSAAEPGTGPGSLSIRDDDGRVLVDLTPQAGVDRKAFRRSAEETGLVVQGTDPERGTLEGFAALDQVQALNALPGRGTLAQAVRPRTSVGSATTRGVALQRVDRVHQDGIDGAGVTIAALSDSYDTATSTLTGQPLTVHAADDVASGDLPGPGNPANPTPVVVLDDDRGRVTTDEGRAMLQVAHDVAPAAKLCFAPAQLGEVTFAANIRRLADKQGPCGADVIVDDVVYYDEPMFSDGIVSDAVDDVAAQGVHYLSAAGNQGSNQARDAALRLVPVEDALAGTNLDLRGVDPALYDGGFADLRSGSGVDVAQHVAVGPGGGLVDLQWDDPVDLDGPTLGAPCYEGSGTVTSAARSTTFTFTPTAEQEGGTVQFRADGVPSGTTDLVMTVTAPDGSVLVRSDTTSSPEVFSAPLTQRGDYTVEVTGYDGETGDFTFEVRPVEEPSAVSTDLNLLLFDAAGRFLGTSADVNAATGRPLELLAVGGQPDVQVVVSRSGTGAVGAQRLRTVLFGDAELAEHVDAADPATFGHATARGATAVAAYDPFPPFLPESYTSPGGTLTLAYDSRGRRLKKSAQKRKVPQLGAADGANTTFFGFDTPGDPDDQPNFFGTSAAAPQAAGLAALVVQEAAGRSRTLSPAALRKRLLGATFDHDLDPFAVSGKASGVVLSARGAPSSETGLVPGSMTDAHFFTLRNDSGKTMRSVTLDGATAQPTGSALDAASPSTGIVFDPRPYGGDAPRTRVGFPFTIGSTDGGLDAASVSASYGAPTGSGQHGQLTITFAAGLERGQQLEFGIDRDLARSGGGTADEGNGADELAGGVDLPTGKRQRSGLTFTLTRTSGQTSVGTLANDLGAGRTAVDGYGLVDAEQAVVGR